MKLNKLDTEKRAKLFKDPHFMMWVTFVKIKYLNPEAMTEAILKTLVKHYGEGVALADVLVAGSKTARVKHIGHKLLSLRFFKWEESENTADDVFTLLRLKNEENELFRSPLLLQWHHNDNKAANEDI